VVLKLCYNGVIAMLIVPVAGHTIRRRCLIDGDDVTVLLECC
jgi:hypothetical protein